MKTLPGRRRSIGLAAGALWMIVISFVFLIWSLLAIGTPLATQVLAGAVLLGAVLVAVGVVVIRAALRLPVSTVPRTPEEQQMGRRFGWVFGAEGLAFAVVTSIAGATGNFILMPSLNLIVVGLISFRWHEYSTSHATMSRACSSVSFRC